MVNQDAKAACMGLLNLNSLCFYDLKGNLMKEIVIGKELKSPEYDPEFLDFRMRLNISFLFVVLPIIFMPFITVSRVLRVNQRLWSLPGKVLRLPSIRQM